MTLLQKTLLCATLWFATVTAASASQRVDRRDVEFTSQGVTLEGTVFLPASAPILAAAVLVHGAGQESRNPGFALAFAQRGIAALTYDKRGVGKSGGVYAGQEVGANNVSRENLELLALDAATAARASRVCGRQSGRLDHSCSSPKDFQRALHGALQRRGGNHP